ncbi:hypothetical protein L7F22_013035 [Adiantum nelumboides]|nr:hypothetical protein [Adiantum nelumboides]
MTPHQHLLRGYESFPASVQVFLGDNRSLNAVGLGYMPVILPSGTTVKVRDVYYVPSLSRNILSVTAATLTGSSIEFFHDYCVVHFKLPSGHFETIKIQQKNRLYPIAISQQGPHYLIASTSTLSLNLTKATSTLLWHYRLGHINSKTLHQMRQKHLCHGLPDSLSPIDLCEGCLLGKASHKPFPWSQTRSTQLNQLVHSDLCGPMETPSLTGSPYFLTFVDDFCRYTTVYFLKLKSLVLVCFQDYCKQALRAHDIPIQVLRSDNGGEFKSNAFQAFCQKEGIQQQFTVPYSPQQNGVSERKNRTLVQSARAVLLTAGLPKSYWEEAVATACYLQNRIPHSIDHDTHRISIGDRMIFVGYGDRFGMKAYSFFNLQQQKFQFSHSVYFDENSLISPQHTGGLPTPLLEPPKEAMPRSSDFEPTSTPQVECEEPDLAVPLLPLVPQPASPQSPAPQSPNPVGTPLPLRAPPWSLAGKTGSYLFPKSPNPLYKSSSTFKSKAQELSPLPDSNFSDKASQSLSAAQPDISSPSSSSPVQKDQSHVPVESIYQPSVQTRASRARSSMSPKMRSLKEIYESSDFSLLLDPSSDVFHLDAPEESLNFPQVSNIFNSQCMLILEAWVEEKRKRDEEATGTSKRATRSSTKKEEAPKPSPEVHMEDVSKDKKQGKPRGPSYKLKSDIELAADLKKVFEERIINSKMEMTLSDILGIAKRKFHEEIIDIIKRKRQIPSDQELEGVKSQRLSDAKGKARVVEQSPVSTVFQAMFRPSPRLQGFMLDNAFGAIQAGTSNPLYGNIGIQSGFQCVVGSYGKPGANLVKVGLSQPYE